MLKEVRRRLQTSVILPMVLIKLNQILHLLHFRHGFQTLPPKGCFPEFPQVYFYSGKHYLPTTELIPEGRIMPVIKHEHYQVCGNTINVCRSNPWRQCISRKRRCCRKPVGQGRLRLYPVNRPAGNRREICRTGDGMG